MWFLNLLSGGLLKVFGDSIVQPILQGYLKSKDVDLEKFKESQKSTTALAVAILEANTKFAETKAQYIMTVLQWWPIRLCLFVLIATSVTRFVLAEFDSTWWWIWGCVQNDVRVYGDVCTWSFPATKGTFGEAEKEFLLFFIIAKPVDTAISGALGLVSKYLASKK